MSKDLFHAVVSDLGHLGVQYNHSKAMMGVIYRSPNASQKSNSWLERKLLRLYTAYYFKVILETSGRFWEDNSTNGLKYTKGGNGDGSKNSV